MEREISAPKKRRWIKFAAIAMPATAAVFAAVFGLSYLFSGGQSKDEATNEMAVFEKEFIEEPEIQSKSESVEATGAGNGSEDYVVAEEAAEDGAPRALEAEAVSDDVLGGFEFSLNIFVAAEGDEELIEFAEDILSGLEGDLPEEMVYDEDMQRINMLLPVTYYESLIEMLDNSESVNFFEDTRDPEMVYDEGLLFEVNFLFQQND